MAEAYESNPVSSGAMWKTVGLRWFRRGLEESPQRPGLFITR